jgi:hypothetical protein
LRTGPRRRGPAIPTILHPSPNISHLSYQVDDAASEELFANDGTVQSAQVVLERDSARGKGFGFVEMGGETGGTGRYRRPERL